MSTTAGVLALNDPTKDASLHGNDDIYHNNVSAAAGAAGVLALNNPMKDISLHGNDDIYCNDVSTATILALNNDVNNDDNDANIPVASIVRQVPPPTNVFAKIIVVTLGDALFINSTKSGMNT